MSAIVGPATSPSSAFATIAPAPAPVGAFTAYPGRTAAFTTMIVVFPTTTTAPTSPTIGLAAPTRPLTPLRTRTHGAPAAGLTAAITTAATSPA